MRFTAITLSLLLLSGAAYAQTAEPTSNSTTITTETPVGAVTTDVTTTVVPGASAPSKADAVQAPAPAPVAAPEPTGRDAITGEPADPNARGGSSREDSLRDRVRNQIKDEARGGR